MARAEIEALGDVFTRLLLLRDVVPMTLRGLLDAFDALPATDRFHKRQLFLVAEGGRHKLDHPGFALNGRLAYSWSRRFSAPDVFLSTVPSLDDDKSLMQLIAWSEADGAFHFFERESGQWSWAGNSFTAFDERARGKGPFDSHINGSLVMKELREPWAHWHSQSSSIPLELLAETDFGKHPGLSALEGAEVLDLQVRAGIRRWTASRIARDQQAGTIDQPRRLIDQVAKATSANLISAKEAYSASMTNLVKLPRSFFIDEEGLVACVKALAGDQRIIPNDKIAVSASHYVDAINTLDIGIQAFAGGLRLKGDTHFCFLVPERAFEDTEVLRQLIDAGWLSPKLALSMLLVDFANPVRSHRRAALARHCPVTPLNAVAGVLDREILASVEMQAGPGSPEEELLSYWNDEDLIGRAREEIKTYMEAVRAHAATATGMLSIMKVAESRRIAFRKRKLNEFMATTAHAGVEVGEWTMSKRGEFITNDAIV